jgi:hypothetical protein
MTLLTDSLRLPFSLATFTSAGSLIGVRGTPYGWSGKMKHLST